MRTTEAGTGIAGRTRHVVPFGRDVCGFPECDGPAVTAGGMCERHRRVSVSATGSWLEAG